MENKSPNLSNKPLMEKEIYYILKGFESNKISIALKEAYHRQKLNGNILFPASRHIYIQVLFFF